MQTKFTCVWKILLFIPILELHMFWEELLNVLAIEIVVFGILCIWGTIVYSMTKSVEVRSLYNKTFKGSPGNETIINVYPVAYRLCRISNYWSNNNFERTCWTFICIHWINWMATYCGV